MSSENILIEKEYVYEITNKNGKTLKKRVVRKYTNKKETSNTLQNRANKELVLKNIKDKIDEIMVLPERKRINFIKINCLPEGISASYNTLKALFVKASSQEKNNSSEELAEERLYGGSSGNVSSQDDSKENLSDE